MNWPYLNDGTLRDGATLRRDSYSRSVTYHFLVFIVPVIV
jgi:hypothetical protein